MAGGVLCVLGCRPGSAALARRTRAGRDAFVARKAALIVACGGRTWDGRVEADEIARMLVDGGVPEAAIVRERESHDTWENAQYSARLLSERGVGAVAVVTCSWHLARATLLFERAGLEVEGIGVDPPDPGLVSRLYWGARERVSTWKDRLR